MQKELDIIMLSTVVDAPFYCKDKIVKCVTEWTPIGESTKKVGELSICINHSEGVLNYYEPQHLYIIEEIENITELNSLLNLKILLIFKSHATKTYSLVTNRVKGIGKYYKIIASTNPLIDCPRINNEFIKSYIKNNNDNKIINSVKVEYFYQCDNCNNITDELPEYGIHTGKCGNMGICDGDLKSFPVIINNIIQINE